MIRLIDTSLWVDLLRKRSPPKLKTFIVPYVRDSDARVAEPVLFELLRNAKDSETPAIEALLSTVPSLATPTDLWTKAASLGRNCRRIGVTPGPLDLLIAQVPLHYNAELVTFDSDFQELARVSGLKVNLLTRP